MLTKILVYLTTTMLCLLAGCGAMLEHSENKLIAANQTRQIAINGIPWGRIKIGFIQGVWSGRIDELPAQIQDIMAEYTDATTGDPNDLTYLAAGYVIGLELRIDEIVFKKFLAERFPELLRYVQ